VAATCIRAGLELELEDETDKSRRHPEFVALHKTSVRIAIEAKSRHRPGVLGREGDLKKAVEASRADVVPLLNQALAKRPGIPFIVFIDVNLPASADGERWSRSFHAAFGDKVAAEKAAVANAVILTSTPHHFGDPLGLDPPKEISIFPIRRPQYPMPTVVLEALRESLSKYGNIPQRFSA
jgi:hypothetical protein